MSDWYNQQTRREDDGLGPLVSPNPSLAVFLATGGTMAEWVSGAAPTVRQRVLRQAIYAACEEVFPGLSHSWGVRGALKFINFPSAEALSESMLGPVIVRKFKEIAYAKNPA